MKDIKVFVLWILANMVSLSTLTIFFGALNWFTADGGESFREACQGPYVVLGYVHVFCLSWVWLAVIAAALQENN